MDVRDFIRRKAELVQPVLLEYTRSENKKIETMLQHTVGAGGKRIRPVLTMLACEAVGGDVMKVLPAAASIELLHTFTLVHDDIVDRDLERRGKPTVHAKWGVDMAIIVGDTLYSKAYAALVDVRENGISDGKVLDALGVLNWANSEIHEGQILDMMFENMDRIGIDDYMEMIRKKTGVMLNASLRIGSILGGGSREEINALSSFGDSIGTAFQMHDDLLDVIADQKKLGKPIGSDIRKKKKSILVIYALNNLKAKEKKQLIGLMERSSKSEQAVREAIELITDSGAIEYAQNMVKSMTEDAKGRLKVLKDSEAKSNLLDVADYIIERNY
ncbi:MAG: polyprenyl synthetase family protein [Candidatus Altiarchaeota archaeon]